MTALELSLHSLNSLSLGYHQRSKYSITFHKKMLLSHKIQIDLTFLSMIHLKKPSNIFQNHAKLPPSSLMEIYIIYENCTFSTWKSKYEDYLLENLHNQLLHGHQTLQSMLLFSNPYSSKAYLYSRLLQLYLHCIIELVLDLLKLNRL